MAFCRLESTARDHWKFKRLAELLRVRRPEARGLFLGLCSWAVTNAPDGLLDQLTHRDIASAADWHGNAERFVQALIDVKLLDVRDDKALEIHDYYERADSYKEARKRRESRAASPTRRGRVTDVSGRDEMRGDEMRGDEMRNPPTPLEPQEKQLEPPRLLADHQSATIPPGSVARVWAAYCEARNKTTKPAPLIISDVEKTHINRLIVWLGEDEACDVVRAWVTMDNANKSLSNSGWPLAWLAKPDDGNLERARNKAAEKRAEAEKRAARAAQVEASLREVI